MIPQAVAQGECTECGQDEDNYTVDNRTMVENAITRDLSCECGTTASIVITTEGLDTTSNVSHKNASWNTESES